jgi:hypothetical protein
MLMSKDRARQEEDILKQWLRLPCSLLCPSPQSSPLLVKALSAYRTGHRAAPKPNGKNLPGKKFRYESWAPLVSLVIFLGK